MRLFPIFYLFFQLSSANSCRILSLSGGGIWGAFEAGIVSNLLEKNIEWDILSGVSAGSLNVATFSTIPKGEMKKHITEFRDFWVSQTSKDIFKDEFFMNGLSLFDTKPFKQMLMKIFKHKIPLRPVLMSATSLKQGKAIVFDRLGILLHGFVNILMASTAIPLVFPPYEFQGDIFVDGGITGNIIIDEAVNWCLKNYPNDPIHVDAVISSKMENYNFNVTMNFGIVAQRTLNIVRQQMLFGELLHHVNEKNIEIIVYEQRKHSNFSILDFTVTKELWNEGYTFSNVHQYKLN